MREEVRKEPEDRETLLTRKALPKDDDEDDREEEEKVFALVTKETAWLLGNALAKRRDVKRTMV